MKRYVLGFMFDDDLTHVIMIKKNRPKWQIGYLNGVGGKKEFDEDFIDAMIREFKEETGVLTTSKDWVWVLTLKLSYAEIEVFAERNSNYYNNVETVTDEEIIKEEVCAIYDNITEYKCISNIPALLELCIQRLQDKEL